MQIIIIKASVYDLSTSLSPKPACRLWTSEFPSPAVASNAASNSLSRVRSDGGRAAATEGAIPRRFRFRDLQQRLSAPRPGGEQRCFSSPEGLAALLPSRTPFAGEGISPADRRVPQGRRGGPRASFHVHAELVEDVHRNPTTLSDHREQQVRRPGMHLAKALSLNLRELANHGRSRRVAPAH